MKIKIREREAHRVERLHEQMKASKGSRELKEGWTVLDQETNCITFSFIVFSPHMIYRAFQNLSDTPCQWHHCTWIAAEQHTPLCKQPVEPKEFGRTRMNFCILQYPFCKVL